MKLRIGARLLGVFDSLNYHRSTPLAAEASGVGGWAPKPWRRRRQFIRMLPETLRLLGRASILSTIIAQPSSAVS
jgi:hypothetical protein